MVKVCKEASAYEHRRSILEVWLSLYTMSVLNRIDVVRTYNYGYHAIRIRCPCHLSITVCLIFGYSLRIPVSIFNSVSTLSYISVPLKSNSSEHV